MTEAKQDGFAPLCPDFVIVLRSQQDRLAVLQEKMQEYIENGTQLGWLIDPFAKRIHIHRPDQSVSDLKSSLMKLKRINIIVQ